MSPPLKLIEVKINPDMLAGPLTRAGAALTVKTAACGLALPHHLEIRRRNNNMQCRPRMLRVKVDPHHDA